MERPMIEGLVYNSDSSSDSAIKIISFLIHYLLAKMIENESKYRQL